MSRGRRRGRRCRTGHNHRVSCQRRIGRHALTTYARLRDQRCSHRSGAGGAPRTGAPPTGSARRHRRDGHRHRRNGIQRRARQDHRCCRCCEPCHLVHASGAARCRRELVHTRGTASPRRVRAERQSGPAQPSTGGHGDAKQIKIFNANSPVFGVIRGVFPQPKGASELYRCPENFPRRATELVAQPRRNTSRTVAASFPNGDLPDGSTPFARQGRTSISRIK